MKNHDKSKMDQAFIARITKDSEWAKKILLDSSVLRLTSSLLEEDSLKSVYLINQLELRPIIARRIVEGFYSNLISDSCRCDMLKRIKQDEYIRKRL